MTCISRRNFLKTSLATGAIISLGSVYKMPVAASEKRMAIFMDTEKCVNCQRCVGACNSFNKLDREHPYLIVKELEGKEGMKRISCMHCKDAACVKACPSNTLYKGENGFTYVNKENCIGCGYCSRVCPYGAVTLYKGKVNKCVGCRDFVLKGELPKCVAACPSGALTYGDWNELTNKHMSPNLYGVDQYGGLGLLMNLSDSPEVYGFPVEDELNFMLNWWKNYLHPGGMLATAAVASMSLLAFGIAKRNYKNEKLVEEGDNQDE